MLLSMVVIVLAMMAPAALAEKPKFDCFKDRGHKRLVDVNKKKAEKAENRGYVCFKRAPQEEE